MNTTSSPKASFVSMGKPSKASRTLIWVHGRNGSKILRCDSARGPGNGVAPTAKYVTGEFDMTASEAEKWMAGEPLDVSDYEPLLHNRYYADDYGNPANPEDFGKRIIGLCTESGEVYLLASRLATLEAAVDTVR